MFRMKSLDELISLASSGAGFKYRAEDKSTADLVKIASAAKKGNARLVFVGLNLRSTAEIMLIADAGSGNITFE